MRFQTIWPSSSYRGARSNCLLVCWLLHLDLLRPCVPGGVCLSPLWMCFQTPALRGLPWSRLQPEPQAWDPSAHQTPPRTQTCPRQRVSPPDCRHPASPRLETSRLSPPSLTPSCPPRITKPCPLPISHLCPHCPPWPSPSTSPNWTG